MISVDPAIAEKGAWREVPQGWRQLYGDFNKLGVSVEWHDFQTPRSLDWGRSFHPQSIEFCLNLSGRGECERRAPAVILSRGRLVIMP
jgi:hypothetical protein